MNYEHLNEIYTYWRKELFPLLSHNFQINSFDDYLKRMSFLPSCKWLNDFEFVKIQRLGFAVDAKKFFKKYKDNCVTYIMPIKPEDGMQRIIYQFSPTLHAEAAIWIWMENDVVNSYVSMMLCFNDSKEYLELADQLWKIKKDGNTEDKQTVGFSTRGVPMQGSPLFGK
jgi:hypothetical protein